MERINPSKSRIIINESYVIFETSNRSNGGGPYISMYEVKRAFRHTVR
jgi:hypothetical protein